VTTRGALLSGVLCAVVAASVQSQVPRCDARPASHHQIYISAAGSHEVAIVDDRTLAIVGRVPGIRFPDGIAIIRTDSHSTRRIVSRS
jgi:hypothetical protein